MKRDKLSSILMELEIKVAASLKRNLKRHMDEEKELGFKWEPWQTAKLRDLERLIVVQYEIEKDVKPAVIEARKSFKDSIREQLEMAFDKGKKKVTQEIIKLKDSFKGTKEVELSFPKAEKQIIKPELFELDKPTLEQKKQIEAFNKLDEPTEKHFFRTNDYKLEALIKDTEKSIDDPIKAVTRYAQDKYKEILEKAQVAFSTGALTKEQAMDMAIDDFVKKGITNIEYKDGSKRNIQSYVEMALRTANHRAFLIGEGNRRKELGIKLVLSTQVVTTCPICLKWQNKVLVDDVFSGGTIEDTENGKYPLLSEAMEDGFLHPNCVHGLLSYFKGITRIPKDVNQGEAKERYDRQQLQRHLELQIRKLKREIEGLSDEVVIEAKKKRIEEIEDKIDSILDSKQKRQREREVNKIHYLEPNSEVAMYKKQLEGIEIQSGIKVTGVSKHFLERVSERKLNINDIENTLKEPLKVGKLKIDSKGNKSIEYIGEHARVHINPDTGNLITCWKTSKKLLEKIRREKENED